jgi:hypothetical protein
MIARSDLTSKFTDGFYKTTSELNSLKSSWRKALDDLIQGENLSPTCSEGATELSSYGILLLLITLLLKIEIHSGHYQGYYRAEEARQYKIFLDKEHDTEKFVGWMTGNFNKANLFFRFMTACFFNLHSMENVGIDARAISLL